MSPVTCSSIALSAPASASASAPAPAPAPAPASACGYWLQFVNRHLLYFLFAAAPPTDQKPSSFLVVNGAKCSVVGYVELNVDLPAPPLSACNVGLPAPPLTACNVDFPAPPLTVYTAVLFTPLVLLC